MQVLTAPGVMIHEIDKSQYSPAMGNTACYVMGFANKGEAYQPMEFTSRTAWLSYYGEPDNEAERYFYAAACEVLNQNGRLYCARLPYDNKAFEKMPGIKYKLKIGQKIDQADLSIYNVISENDSEIKDVATIKPASNPIMYDLAEINEFRADEKKVASDTFLIVDTTGASYGKVTEDFRKGQKQEVIGIVPVVTTAANALYAQSMISADLSDIYHYETLGGNVLKTLVHDGLENAGLSVYDTVNLFNTKEYFKIISSEVKVSAFLDICDLGTAKTKEEALTIFKSQVSELNTKSASELSIDNLIEASFEVKPDSLVLVETEEGIKPEDMLTINDIVLNVKKLATYNKLTFDIRTLGDAVIAIYTMKEMAGITSPSSDPTLTIASLTTEINDLFEKYQTHYVWQGTAKYQTKVTPYYESEQIPTTQSLDANKMFPTIQAAVDGEGFDPEHLKDIGVVVYKMFLDPSEGNKVSFEAVEAFAGSLYKDDKDPNTGVTKFIDTIINSQSKYINFFSNCFNTPTSKNFYLKECDILIAPPSTGVSLGLYKEMTKEDISITKSIYDGMNKCFDKVADVNQLDIDIVPDAGISNIASYLKAIFNNKGPYDLTITDDLGNSMLNMWKCDKASNEAIKTWKTVVQKLDTFCKNRKDCMFITECPRPLVLTGQKKVVRPTKPDTNIDVNILPYLKAVTGLNTNYGAGYLDWFEQADEYTGDFFWCPPSIKAMGVYLYTDANFYYWDAPAGLNRGIVAATDVAFSPNAAQAGAIYEKSWNYAINYPNDGIVLEGQKTFQVKPSAFDRVNVRRLFLRLERQAFKVARYFVYEGNTAYTRQRLVDALDPYFKEAKVKGGIYDYKIIADETINTPTTIDRNELHVNIGIKPVKSAEYIYLNFIALSTGGSWEEAGL